MSDSSLNAKRAHAKARLRAANQKVSRLQKKGVNVAGTKYDPRRPAERIDRYNSKQLDALVSKLDKFTSRRTQFVGDVDGRPINPRLIAAYKQREQKINEVKRREWNRIKNVGMPTLDEKNPASQTIAERMEMITPKFKHAGISANNPYSPTKLRPSNFASEAALKKLIKKLDQKLKPVKGKNFLQRDLEVDRGVVEQMLNTLNRRDMLAKVNKLTNAQFNVLFNFWGFVDKVALPYDQMKMDRKSGETDVDPWVQKQLNSNLKQAEKLIGNAARLKLDS